jgi:F-type H+-transporting ATPase subunit b
MELLKIISFSDGLTIPSGEDFINKVFPNIWAFLIQLIAFLIMSFVVIKFAYKPVSAFLAKRREFIASNLKEAEEKNLQANENILKAEQSLQESKKEAVKIIQEAQKEASKEKDAILEEAKKELAIKRMRAQEDIKREQEKAIKEVHDEVVDLAYETTKTILNREVSSKDDKKMIDDFVNDLIEKR